jgi:DNA-binding SARP family transcriptional activator
MEFKILGPLAVIGPNGPVTLRGTRQRRLLATLVLDPNAVVPSSRLIEQLWPDPPETARQQLHNAVAALRRCLGEDGAGRIVTTETGYRIDLDLRLVDAHVFEEDVAAARAAAANGDDAEAARLLEIAMARWRGPALAGLDGGTLPAAAARLEEQRCAALEQLFAVRLRLGRHEEVIAALTEFVHEQPLRESARASLILALYRSGRQSDALEAYREGHRLIAAELGLDPSPVLQELRDRILRGDPDLAAPRPASGGEPSGSRPRPAFLPPGTRDFTGRATEIEQLLAEAAREQDHAPSIVTVDGMGGVGKTTLAVHVGHRLAGKYPDGQYYVDLYGFTADRRPLSAFEALDLLLRGSGLPAEDIQPGLEGRAAQWRSRLSGQRALVLLDNASDEAQVRPLLPGTPGVFVLVTSRRRLATIDGAVPMSLDVLPAADAAALFSRISADDHGDDVADIVGLCGRLPLAIGIAASRLRQHPRWGAGHLAELLRSQQQRNRLLAHEDRGVTAVLAVSHAHLAPETAGVLRLLGLHPGPDFDRFTVAALAACEPGEADQHLDRLFAAHLIEHHSDDRYRLHDLVRDFAQGLAARGDSDTPRRRLFDYHLYLAHVCCRPLARGFSRFDPDITHVPASLPPADSEAATMRLLKVELPNLVASTRYAIDRGWHDHAWQIPCTLQPFFTRVNYRENSLELFEGALGSARARGSKRGEAACLTNIALTLRDRGLYKEVGELLRRAIELSREIDDEPTIAYLYANLGISHIRAGQLPQADDTFTRAREIAIRLDDQQAYAAFTNNLGVVASRSGKLDAASKYFAEALGAYQEVGFRQGEAITYVNFGEAHLLAGEVSEAFEVLTRARDIAQAISYNPGTSFALCFLGIAHRLAGNLAAATDSAQQALDLARQFAIGEVECEALNSLGEGHLAADRLSAAEASFHDAHERAAGLHLPLAVARAEEGLAHVAQARGDAGAAYEHWTRAVDTYPAGVADAADAVLHLGGHGEVVCRRCRVGGDGG